MMLRSFAVSVLLLFGSVSSGQGAESVSFSAYRAYFSNSDNSIEKSGIKATWSLPSITTDIQHFAVKWYKASEAGAGANMESSPLITHLPDSLEYDYDMEDLVQGECYYVFLHTTYNDNSLSSSGPIVVQTDPAVPHNVAFQANGWDATVTWNMHGEYIGSTFIVQILTGSGAVKSVCHLYVDENPATVCNITLLQGVHYDTVAVTLSVSSTCSFIPEGRYGILPISYTTAPATPTNVALTNYPTSPSDTLVASWEMSISFPWIYHVVVVTDSNGNTVRLDYIVGYEAAISALSSSEKYFVTVQAVNLYTQPVYGAVSEPSNNAVTTPGTFTISASEVLDAHGTPMQTVYVSWGKPRGGEEIETYEVSWKKNGEATSSGESQIAHVKGYTFYDMFVNNLESGEKYDFEVTAINSAGSSKSNTVTVMMK